MKNRFVSLILVASILHVNLLHASTTEEWRATMYKHMELVTATHFHLLLKDYFDLQKAITAKLKQRQLSLERKVADLENLQSLFSKSPGIDGSLIRKIALAKKEIDILHSLSLRDTVVLHRANQQLSNVCSTENLARHEADYDAGSLVPIKETFEDLNTSIDKVIAADDPQYSFSITVGTQGAYVGNSHDGLSNSWQGAVVGGCAAAGSIIGGAIGTAIPVIGNIVGAFIGGLIGSVVGTVLVGIIGGIINGGESVSDMLADSLRENIPRVIEALNSLKGKDSKELLASHCNRIFAAESTNAFVQAVTGAAGFYSEQGNALVDKSKQIVASVENISGQRLDALIHDHAQVFQQRFELSFEKYLSERSQRSKESKDYFQTQIIPEFAKVSKETAFLEHIEAEDKLWTLLIEGDAKYTKSKSIHFLSDEKADPADRLIYWSPATTALLEQWKGLKQ